MTSPAASRRQLANRLKELRTAADRTQQEVADYFGWSPSKVIRIEKGDVGVGITDVRALLDFYGVTDKATVNDLASTARGSRARQPFSEFQGAISRDTLQYFQWEATASYIRHVALNAVPGLLQTEDYTRALLTAYGTDESKIELTVASRRRRQELLDRDAPPRMDFILDEGLLHRLVGGPDVMASQIDRLVEVARHPMFNVKVLPFALGAHAALSGPFVLLEFPTDDDPDVAFFENTQGDTVSRGRVEIYLPYKERFTELQDAASNDLLQKLAGHVSSH